MRPRNTTDDSLFSGVGDDRPHQPSYGGNTKRDSVGGNRTRTGDKNPKEKHTCTKFKLLVWRKEEKCPEYERNADKRWVGWKSALELDETGWTGFSGCGVEFNINLITKKHPTKKITTPCLLTKLKRQTHQ